MIQLHPIVNQAGLHLEYQAWSAERLYAPLVREDFNIDILDTWTGGVTFRYTANQRVLGMTSGLQTLTSLDDCQALDPWWEPSKIAHDDRCELWMPSDKFRELIVEHKTYLAVDSLVRRDSVVRWDYMGKIIYPCEINGQIVLLQAIQVKTSRDDVIVILDDVDYPLILSMNASYFKWELVKIAFGSI